MIDMEKSSSAAYAAAGVDITAGYKGVKLMRADVQRTHIPVWFLTLAASAASLLPTLPG